MDVVQKAIWFVESNLGEDWDLDQAARACGVSRFHLARAFGLVMGESVMSYRRARRLSEAAKALASGAPDILHVALDAGYGSHEAFTRAFGEYFSVMPETVRTAGHTDNIDLKEARKMTEDLLEHLDEPRIESGRAMIIVGLSERYTDESASKIPMQWQRFAPHIGHIHGQVGMVSYGLCYDGDDDGRISYMCGVEVTHVSDLPGEFAAVKLEPRKYAVFTHKDHISQIRRTWKTIYGKWFPQSGLTRAEAPEFELYDERFNPQTGEGGLEIWIPLSSF